MSPSLGLGVDNLLEMDIVTPDGDLLTISECLNPDLFWAVRHDISLESGSVVQLIVEQFRGGGGATFGITVSATYEARPFMPLGIAYFTAIVNRTFGLHDTRRIVTALAGVAPSLGDLGIGGIFSTASGSPGGVALFVHPGSNAVSIANGKL
jgi:hypothetical protein